MLDFECDTGKKVICKNYQYRNRIGYITTVIRSNGKVASYMVKDKIGFGAVVVGGGMWYALSEWDLCQDQQAQDPMPNTLRSGSLPKSIICPCGINRKDCDYHKE
jgi:hypothetical protein